MQPPDWSKCGVAVMHTLFRDCQRMWQRLVTRRSHYRQENCPLPLWALNLVCNKVMFQSFSILGSFLFFSVELLDLTKDSCHHPILVASVMTSVILCWSARQMFGYSLVHSIWHLKSNLLSKIINTSYISQKNHSWHKYIMVNVSTLSYKLVNTCEQDTNTMIETVGSRTLSKSIT